jgi:hypothetical protein
MFVKTPSVRTQALNKKLFQLKTKKHDTYKI